MPDDANSKTAATAAAPGAGAVAEDKGAAPSASAATPVVSSKVASASSGASTSLTSAVPIAPAKSSGTGVIGSSPLASSPAGGWLPGAAPASTDAAGSQRSRTAAPGNSPRSPDDLEEVIQVIPRRAWYAGIGGLIMSVLLVSWSIFGQVETLISANGILIRPGGVRDVYPEAAGIIQELFVKQGDSVQVGDPIARILPVGMARDLQNVESEIANLQTQAKLLRAQLLAKSSKSKATPQSDDPGTPVLDDSSLTGPAATNAVPLCPVVLPPPDPNEDTATKAARAALAEVDKRTSDLVLRLRKLDKDVKSYPVLNSPLAGFIVELNVTENMDVDARTSLVQMELTGAGGADLLGVLYVDSADASTMVEVGMMAEIRPPGLSNETGSLVGEVSRVATFPSNKKQMMRVIGHEELVNLWLKDRLLKEVHITLKHNKLSKDDNMYEWTGRGTSALEIPSGTICTAQIVVKKTAPIAYIFPMYHRTAR